MEKITLCKYFYLNVRSYEFYRKRKMSLYPKEAGMWVGGNGETGKVS
jgi:hypothetical protein